MSVRWRIELLGRFHVARGERDDFRFATRKTAALLAYLAYYPGKSFSRESLADQFWPDNDPESARNSLRVALNALRKLLDAADQEGEPARSGEELLQTDRSSVQLNASAFSTDVADFERVLRTERDVKDPAKQRELLLEAAALYQGPLLLGWYEEWISGEQTRLAEVYAAALRRLTALLMDAQELDRALDFARRAAQADPLREETHRLLIRLHSLAGNTAAALAQYRELETKLDQELGTVPSRVTRELMRQILSTDRAEATTAAKASSEPAAPAAPPTPPAPVSPQPVNPVATRFFIPARPLTRFFGRESEMTKIGVLLTPGQGECCRLVTLTGMGGTGKTRLALEAVSTLVEKAKQNQAVSADVFSGGVFVVTLAEVDRPQLLEKAVATALVPHDRNTVSPTADADGQPREQIIAVLNQRSPDGQPKPVLLVLDNFEQLVESGADWVARLMQDVPGLSCLITSRQRLDIAGEQEIPLAPLPVPAASWEGRNKVALNLDAFPSVRLFLDRARGVRPDFALTERNAASVAELCARLDGLPLALELAAAWARLLTPAQMLERLNARFDLLVAAQRDISPRHRSLRAVLDETCRLMPDELRQAFAALSVFRGGWTLPAAEAVVKTVTGSADVLEMIALLQQQSLVSVSERTEEARFHMLETVREYAATLLSQEETARARQAHAVFFADFAHQAAPHLNRIEGELWANRLEEELDNLRAALEVVQETGTADATENLPLAVALWRYWYARGRAEEGLAALQAYLAKQTPALLTSLGERSCYTEACQGAGRLALVLGQATYACQVLQEGMRIAQATPEVIGRHLGTLAINFALAARAAGDPQSASAAYRVVLEQKQKENDLWGAAFTLSELGVAYLHAGDTERAAAALREGYLLHSLLGDQGRARECQALLARVQGSDEEAPQMPTMPGDALAGSYLTLGHIAVEQEDFPVALALLEDARRGFLDSGNQSAITLTYERIGLAAIGAGDAARARHALEEARARRELQPQSQPEVSSVPLELWRKHQGWLDTLMQQARYLPKV